ncbi:hypothetical protein DY000_02008812 [Brassica cretica]|uniref:Uncharacterized protein n=1 Tax=Brassica cretica TaxID=69181 RepID=A0ABQ7BYM5_BRACR|nr:hypothetical protein DY000_02008812 [Brassica cretica]
MLLVADLYKVHERSTSCDDCGFLKDFAEKNHWSNAPVYSEVQSSRINNALPLPSVLKGAFKIVEGPASSATGHPECCCFGREAEIGVVLSSGQAPGGHNVISGLFGSPKALDEDETELLDKLEMAAVAA